MAPRASAQGSHRRRAYPGAMGVAGAGDVAGAAGAAGAGAVGAVGAAGAAGAAAGAAAGGTGQSISRSRLAAVSEGDWRANPASGCSSTVAGMAAAVDNCAPASACKAGAWALGLPTHQSPSSARKSKFSSPGGGLVSCKACKNSSTDCGLLPGCSPRHCATARTKGGE